MSHWTKTKTKLNNMDYMKSALKRMGITEYKEGGKISRAYDDSEGGRVDISIDGHVGLRQEEDGTISIVGDHYYSQHAVVKQPEKFKSELTKNYLVSEAFAKVEEQSFYIYENEKAEVGADGLIRMRARALYSEE